MPEYANFSGRSGVESFDLGERSISVTFRGGRTYSYNHETVGKVHVDRLIELAEAGYGLSAYIAAYLRRDCSTNWPRRKSARRRW